jgi:hypothetical protein
LTLAFRHVLGMRVDATSYEDASQRVARWAHDGRSAYVCVATVHMTMEAFDSSAFQRVVNGADLVTPDGRPLVWALRSLGVRDATQVRGTDLTTHVVERIGRPYSLVCRKTWIWCRWPRGYVCGMQRFPIRTTKRFVSWRQLAYTRGIAKGTTRRQLTGCLRIVEADPRWKSLSRRLHPDYAKGYDGDFKVRIIPLFS